jgi:hypothetical protein
MHHHLRRRGEHTKRGHKQTDFRTRHVCISCCAQAGLSLNARDAKGRTPLHYFALPAFRGRLPSVTPEGLTSLTSFLQYGRTPPQPAASSSAPSTVEPCDVLAQDECGDTALHVMTRNSLPELVGVLLRDVERLCGSTVLRALLWRRNRAYARAIDMAADAEVRRRLARAHSVVGDSISPVLEKGMRALLFSLLQPPLEQVVCVDTGLLSIR